MNGFGRIGTAAVLALAILAGGCKAIDNKRGYLAEDILIQSVQPGIDNKKSVERTLGRPTFTSEYGQDSWYYVSSMTRQKPFHSPKIREHTIYQVDFDAAGNVIGIEQSGMDRIVRLDPEGDKTPTLGRERSFLQDLFGNIGAVGAAGAPAGGS